MEQFHQELVIGGSPEEIKSRMDALGRQGYRLVSAGINDTPTTGASARRSFWAFMEKPVSFPPAGGATRVSG